MISPIGNLRRQLRVRWLGNQALSKDVHNERTKLTAGWLNGMSLAIFTASGFGPWLTLVNVNGPHYDATVLAVISILCILISFGQHLTAREFLRRIRP